MIINAAEHAWVTHDERFRIDPEVSSCRSTPTHEQSGEYLIGQMKTHGVDRVVISHVCYYGRDNTYTSHCVQTWPDRFAGIGLLVGHRLHPPGDPENPARLERACSGEGLAGMRLSPIYDKGARWFDDPIMFPFWEKAQDLACTFNIFLAPEQIGQVATMAERFPGVSIVIDHFAMIDISRPDDEGIAPLAALHRFPNVYVRTSLHNPSKEQVPFRDMWPYLQQVYDAFGPRRLIYANMYELLIVKDLIPFFTAEDKEWILGKTAARLYFGEGA